MTRLDAVALPAFSRLCWAGGAARVVWAPRLLRVADQWIDLVLAVARDGQPPVLPVAARPDTSHKLRAAAARAGLAVAPAPPVPGVRVLPWRARSTRPSRSVPQPLVVGRPAAVEALRAAARADDAEGVRRLLDVPACCARARSDEHDGWVDPWWPLATRTAARLGLAPPASHRIDLPAGASRALLLGALHIPALWFEPCTLICSAAAERAERLERALAHAPGGAELEWLDALAGWPVAWSGLHGIAELKTPVFKLLQPTDPTAETLVVRLQGSEIPEGAAHGVRFPFVQRRRSSGRSPAAAGS